MNAGALDRKTIVPFIADIFADHGAESYLGEDVTMAEHMLQAATLAQREAAPDVLIAAALLHDIGHFTDAFAEQAFARGVDQRHDRTGAQLLEPFFPAVVTACAGLHVTAKRYLCATDPAYFGDLSAASVKTLTMQGGPMADEERAAFEANPYHRQAIRVRRWDDGGKVAGAKTPTFADFAPLLQRLVDRHAAAG